MRCREIIFSNIQWVNVTILFIFIICKATVDKKLKMAYFWIDYLWCDPSKSRHSFVQNTVYKNYCRHNLLWTLLKHFIHFQTQNSNAKIDVTRRICVKIPHTHTFTFHTILWLRICFYRSVWTYLLNEVWNVLWSNAWI